MDIFFSDPTEVPLPPNEVRINNFEAEFWPDGKRVRIILEITPFQRRPSGEITLTNRNGEELANVSIVETMDPRMEFTLHLRGAEILGPFNVNVTLFYRQLSAESDSTEIDNHALGLPHIVDQSTIIITQPPGG